MKVPNKPGVASIFIAKSFITGSFAPAPPATLHFVTKEESASTVQYVKCVPFVLFTICIVETVRDTGKIN